MDKAIGFLEKEAALLISVSLLIILSVLYPQNVNCYFKFVDWETITALVGLLIITTGIKESGYLEKVSWDLTSKFKTEGGLSLYLVLLSLLLSTFLTNDITLFIVVPLTLSIQSVIKNDIHKLIILEAISVNVGSALTPIGNPQNLFLWHQWHISFMRFLFNMFPLVTILIIPLLVLVWLSFSRKELQMLKIAVRNQTKSRKLFVLSVAILIFYVICLDLKVSHKVLPFVVLLYFFIDREVFLKLDWLLVFFFIMIFIDSHILANVSVISRIINSLNLDKSSNVFFLSALVSQLISNVPASVFMSKFSHDWLAIAYGVNVGGNGIIIGSLANIIAVRIAGGKRLWVTFHKYSIPYFLLTCIVVYLLFL